MRRCLVCAVCCFFLAVAVFGCAKGPQLSPPQAKKNENKIKVAVITAGQDNDDNKTLRQVVTEQAKEKMDLIWLDARGDALKQEEGIQRAIKEKAKVVIWEPVDDKMAVSGVQELQKEGIKVICVGLLPPDTAVDALITPDYRRAGEIQGQQVLTSIPQGQSRDVLILRGPKDNKAAEELVQGNLGVLTGSTKIKEVMEETLMPGDASGAFAAVNKQVEKKEVPVIISLSPEYTLGALKALEEANKAGSVGLFGIGTPSVGVEGLKDDKVTSLVDLRPDYLAQMLVQTADQLASDEPWEYEETIQNGSHNVPARFTPIRSITAENAELLKTRLEDLKKEQKQPASASKEEAGGEKQSEGSNPGGNEGEKSEGENKGGEGGNTVVKIKTKDGQEFTMNIKGEIESIEMKKEEQGQEGEGGKEGEEKKE